MSIEQSFPLIETPSSSSTSCKLCSILVWEFPWKTIKYQVSDVCEWLVICDKTEWPNVTSFWMTCKLLHYHRALLAWGNPTETTVKKLYQSIPKYAPHHPHHVPDCSVEGYRQQHKQTAPRHPWSTPLHHILHHCQANTSKRRHQHALEQLSLWLWHRQASHLSRHSLPCS